MGFVTERLNSQLEVIDTIFHLDADHDDVGRTFASLFTPAAGQETTPDAIERTAVTIWEALQSSALKPSPAKHSGDAFAEDHLPPLPEVGQILERIYSACYGRTIGAPIDESNASTESQPSVAQLASLAKCVAVLHAHLLNKLLNNSTALPPDIAYWREKEYSKLRSGYYLVQTLPHRIYHYGGLVFDHVRSHHPANVRPELKTLAKEAVSALQSVWHSRYALSPGVTTSFIGLRLANLRPPPTLFELARREIRAKRERLEAVHELQAACLGLLADRGIGIAATTTRISKKFKELRVASDETLASSGDEVRGALSKSLALMAGVLTRMADVSRKHDTTSLADVEDLAYLDDEASQVTPQTVSILYRKAYGVYTSLSTFDDSFASLLQTYGRPSPTARMWAPVLLSSFAAYRAASTLAFRWDDVLEWAEALKDTVASFWSEWILKPLRDIYSTIRHKEARLAIQSSESLNADLASLERMIVDYAEHRGITDPLMLQEVAKQAQSGDLSVVLQRYTEEIKAPLKNAITGRSAIGESALGLLAKDLARQPGDLIRALLIQIQKAKVDGELAISALDKLLRSNELNFAFLAVVPSLLVTWSLSREVRRLLSGGKSKSRKQSYEMIRSSLRNIDRLLNRSNRSGSPPALSYKSHGLLLCEVYLLRRLASSVPRRANTRQRFIEDLRELESGYCDDVCVADDNHTEHDWTVTQRMETVHRMWRTYAFARDS
ncbi:ATP synthase regulation protein NCA2-domain-containing protein [Gaertneriomyces semiglobifer]|nr:ATP synthase regulation protein NCA2-domain-containing protein [Gaertneriomyces semiglobifer]